VEKRKNQSTRKRLRARNENTGSDTKLNGFLRYNQMEPTNHQQHTIRARTPSYRNKAHSCTRMPSVEPLARAAARIQQEPVRAVWRPAAAVSMGDRGRHHKELAIYIGEAGGTLVPRLGECGVGGFAEKLHGPRTKPPQGFKRDRAECISRAVVVGEVVPALVGITKSSGMASGAGAGPDAGSSQGMDERDVGENVARPGVQVAVKVPACQGAVGGAARKPGVSPFSARGEAQALSYDAPKAIFTQYGPAYSIFTQ
jgi:hypothetical protein